MNDKFKPGDRVMVRHHLIKFPDNVPANTIGTLWMKSPSLPDDWYIDIGNPDFIIVATADLERIAKE